MSLYYKTIGEGKPVILIHGFGVDHRLMKGCMEPIFNELQGYKRIYIDLPGMGKSNNIEDVNSSDKVLQSVLDLIDSIIPLENFILIGESYGGYISRGICSKLKNRVEAMGLICPVIIADKTKRTGIPPHQLKIIDNDFLKTLESNEKEDFISNNVIVNERIYKRYKKEIVSGIEISNRKVLSEISTNYDFSFNPDKEVFINPVIFFTGRQDSVVGYRDVMNIIELYPKSSLVLLDNAGHNLQIEQSEVFTNMFVGWFKQYCNK